MGSNSSKRHHINWCKACLHVPRLLRTFAAALSPECHLGKYLILSHDGRFVTNTSATNSSAIGGTANGKLFWVAVQEEVVEHLRLHRSNEFVEHGKQPSMGLSASLHAQISTLAGILMPHQE